MPAYQISYKHSAMKPDYVGVAIKHAHTADDAVKFLGKYDRRERTVIDKRRNVLTIISIEAI